MSSLIIAGDTSGQITIAAPAVAGSNTLTLPVITDTITTLNSTQTLANKTLTAPVLSGTATGTYTLGGTPTISSPTISAPTLSGTATGTYTLGGTPTISSPTISAPVLSGTATGTYTLGGTPSLAATALTGTIAAARLPAGSVLQVVSTFTQTKSSFTGNDTYQSYTALNTSITPSSSSSKILILISFGTFGGSTGTTTCSLQLLRNSTPIGVGSTSGSQKAATFKTIQWNGDPNHGQGGVGFTFLDSPATTSSITYSFNINPQHSFTFYINRNAGGGTGGEAYNSPTGSSMTLLEIAG